MIIILSKMLFAFFNVLKYLTGLVKLLWSNFVQSYKCIASVVCVFCLLSFMLILEKSGLEGKNNFLIWKIKVNLWPTRTNIVLVGHRFTLIFQICACFIVLFFVFFIFVFLGQLSHSLSLFLVVHVIWSKVSITHVSLWVHQDKYNNYLTHQTNHLWWWKS